MRIIGSIIGVILFIALISFIVSSVAMSEEEVDEINREKCMRMDFEDRNKSYIYDADTNECNDITWMTSEKFRKQVEHATEVSNTKATEMIDCLGKETDECNIK